MENFSNQKQTWRFSLFLHWMLLLREVRLLRSRALKVTCSSSHVNHSRHSLALQHLTIAVSLSPIDIGQVQQPTYQVVEVANIFYCSTQLTLTAIKICRITVACRRRDSPGLTSLQNFFLSDMHFLTSLWLSLMSSAFSTSCLNSSSWHSKDTCPEWSLCMATPLSDLLRKLKLPMHSTPHIPEPKQRVVKSGN